MKKNTENLSEIIKKVKEEYPKIQCQDNELLLIAGALARYSKPNFLIFGVGYDAELWLTLNQKGRTVLLEDNPGWFSEIKKLCPAAEIYLIKYPTKISQWKSLLGKDHELSLELPDTVIKTDWDIIFVDGPCGDHEWHMQEYGFEPPGRMMSIYMSSRLIKNGGDIFVHDCQRKIESRYSDRYLKACNFVTQVKGRSILRHYNVKRNRKNIFLEMKLFLKNKSLK